MKVTPISETQLQGLTEWQGLWQHLLKFMLRAIYIHGFVDGGLYIGRSTLELSLNDINENIKKLRELRKK